MKNQLVCSLQKDIKEYIRTKKNLLFSLILFFLCLSIFMATQTFPMLIGALVKNTSHIVNGENTIISSLMVFFPRNLKDNMGILSSDIIIFYGIVVILSAYNLINTEIKRGKWIFPLSVGYKPCILIISKGMVYSVGAAIPSVIFYNLYYMIGNIFLLPDYHMQSMFLNSILMGIAIFAIVYSTIMLSVIYKQSIMSIVTIIPFVAVAPDIFVLFEFGKYLPTHILTYLYQTRSDYNELFIPIFTTLFMAIFLSILASKKSLNIEVTR